MKWAISILLFICLTARSQFDFSGPMVGAFGGSAPVSQYNFKQNLVMYFAWEETNAATLRTNYNSPPLYSITNSAAATPWVQTNGIVLQGGFNKSSTGGYRGNGPAINWTSNDFTMTAWVKLVTGTYTSQGIFAYGDNTGGGNGVSIAYRAANDASPRTRSISATAYLTNASTYVQILSGLNSMTENTWTHVAFIRRNLTNYQIWLNGVVKFSSNYNAVIGNGYTAGATNVEIGMINAGYGIQGAVDEFGAWSRALSTNEVLQLYNSGAGWGYTNF